MEDSQQKDKSEAMEPIFGKEAYTITQWKQENIRRRISVAEIYSLCVEDYNLMCYLSGKSSSIQVSVIMKFPSKSKLYSQRKQ